MAKSITPLPTLSGKDAIRFVEEMMKPATPEHIARLEKAKKVYETFKAD
jgi:hypothetical protein